MAIETVRVTEPAFAGDTRDVAVDTIGGTDFQVVKIALGADGAMDTLVDSGQQTMANSLPVAIASDQGVIPVSDGAGSLTVDGTVELGATSLAALETVELGATTLAALETLTVAQITAALPAGANNIGDVDIASALPAGANNIGAVDIAVVVPGTGATNLGKAEDAAHTTGDTGVMMLAVRNDAGATMVSADLDYSPMTVTSSGAVRVSVVGGLTNVQFAEDSAHVSGNTGTMALAVRNDAGSQLGSADGDYVPLSMQGAYLLVKDENIAAVVAEINDGISVTQGAKVLVSDQANLHFIASDTSGQIASVLASDKIMVAGVPSTPKFAIIDAAGSGDNTLVAAVLTAKIRVLSLSIVAAGAVTVRFEGGAGGTALTGQMSLAANGSFTLPFSPVGHFETAVNTLLNMELSGAVSVDGVLTYIEV